MINKKVRFQDLGTLDYKECWDFQEKLFNEVIAKKLQNRDHPESAVTSTENHLLFVEHPHVYTLGKSGDEKNLLVSAEVLKEKNASFYKINRGGDITYHGPGQLVVYPILDLDNFFTDIHKYLRLLEEVVIKTIADYQIIGGRNAGETGVWIDSGSTGNERKICAMGIRCSRWVTMHGIALNVSPNLEYFNNIIPCGIQNKVATSMEKEIGVTPVMLDVKNLFKKNFSAIFDCEIV